MEVEKLFKIVIEHLSDYLGVLFNTIRSPRFEFQPIETLIENPIVTQEPNSKTLKARPHPKLLIFLFISITIGSILNTNIPRRNTAPNIMTTMIIVFVCWLLFSSLVHIVCKLFAGRASLMQTLSINLQVLAVIYVLSSFAAFLWGVIVWKNSTYLESSIWKTLINEPIYFYFVIQFILIFIYLPWANRRVHKFSFVRSRKIITNRTFANVLSLAEVTSFYIVFLTIALAIVSLSKTSYEVHNVPLNENKTKDNPPIVINDSINVPQSKITKVPRRRRLNRQYVVKDPVFISSAGNPDKNLSTATEQTSARLLYIDKNGDARGYPGVFGR